MRSVFAIKSDINSLELEYKTRRENLVNELTSFQNKCPHTSDFLIVIENDEYDSGYGVDRYSSTTMKVTCMLCEKTSYSEPYQKGDFLTTRKKPDPCEVISK